MGNDWKTTVGGAVSAIGDGFTAVALLSAPPFSVMGVPAWVGLVGIGLRAAGSAWLGYTAKAIDARPPAGLLIERAVKGP